MNIFTKLSSLASGASDKLTTLVTRKVVETKVKKVIADLKVRDTEQKEAVTYGQDLVDESTGTLGDVVDSLFSIWGKGYNGLNNTALISVCEQEEAITNLVANNADALVSIGTAFTKLNTDINKQSVMSIVMNIKEACQDYLTEEYKPECKEEFETNINPKLKDTGMLWGMKEKWYLMDVSEKDAQQIKVTEEEYNEFKVNYKALHGKWDESTSMFVTRQTSCIKPKNETTEQFYSNLGINYEMIKDRV